MAPHCKFALLISDEDLREDIHSFGLGFLFVRNAKGGYLVFGRKDEGASSANMAQASWPMSPMHSGDTWKQTP